jgi:nucleoside-diphosphate-sugar epimerase
VRGFIMTMKSEKLVGRVTNIGSGFEISIGDTAHTIAELMGAKIEIETDQQRLRPAASEVERLFASYAKAEELMGWRPNYGGLDGFKRGMIKTIDWFTKPDNLRRYKSDVYNI